MEICRFGARIASFGALALGSFAVVVLASFARVSLQHPSTRSAETYASGPPGARESRRHHGIEATPIRHFRIPDALTAGGADCAAVGILGSQAPDDRVVDVLDRRTERTDRPLIAIVDADPAGRASGSRLAALLGSRGQPLHVVEAPDGLDLNGWTLNRPLWTIALAPEALRPVAPHQTRLEHLST